MANPWESPACGTAVTDTTTGEVVTSFTMLTVNADGHPVMGRFHRPEDENRSVVVLESGRLGDWMAAQPSTATSLIIRPDD
jgi:putative SOS response-associated peptidase YedK